MKLAEAIPRYLDHAQVRRSHGWVRHQRTYLEREVGPRFGDLELAAVTPMMLEDYIHDCAQRMKNTTVNKRLSCLRRLFAWAVDRHLLELNPAASIERLPDDTTIHSDILSRTELDALLAVSAPKLRMFVILAYHTGLRAGEATRLRWRDIDFDRRMIRVAGEKAGRDRVERLRWVPINVELLAALRAFHETPPGCHEHLFEHGGRPTWSNLNRVFKEAVAAAGLAKDKWVTPHTLRHTFGAEMAMRGVPLRKLQLLMGHSTIVTTETWYAHYSPDYLLGATDVLVDDR